MDIREILGMSEAENTGSRDISGNAKRERKLDVSMSSYVYFDNLNQAIEQCGRIVLDLLPVIAGDDERPMMINKKDGTTQQVMINQKQDDGSVLNRIETGEFDVVEVIYSQFKNAATQKFEVERFLPIPKVEAKAGATKADFIYDPSKEELIAELMPKILNTQLYKAVLDSNASEHGARMTAMDKASDNAQEMLRSLKISYNRARQAAITTELTEIVSGAAALQG